jgi:hypothetical protein
MLQQQILPGKIIIQGEISNRKKELSILAASGTSSDNIKLNIKKTNSSEI